jgi:hypothetical protein
LPSAWAGDPLLPPAFGGEGVHRPCKEGELRLHGAGRLQALLAAACLAPWLRWPWGRLRRCLLPLGRGVAVRPPHERWLRRARVRHIHGFSRTTGRTGGGRTRRRTPRGWRRCSWMVLSSLHGRTGARTSSRAPRQPPSTGAEVAAVIGAEVVAAAGEVAPCRGGCLRCRGHQSHLLLSPRLFGFNGLAVTPRRRTGARTYLQ